MTFNDSHEEMSSVELHGTQLRMAIDKLDYAINDLDTRSHFLLRRATAICDTQIIRNEIRAQLQGGELGVEASESGFFAED